MFGIIEDFCTPGILHKEMEILAAEAKKHAEVYEFITFYLILPQTAHCKCQKIIYCSIIYKDFFFCFSVVIFLMYGLERQERNWNWGYGQALLLVEHAIYLASELHAFKFLPFPVLNLTNVIKAEVGTRIIHLLQMEKLN